MCGMSRDAARSFERLEAHLARLRAPSLAKAIERVRGDLAAVRFHQSAGDKLPPIVAVIGGTGTGKSTLVNRLLGVDVTAASFRRTFTAGPIAITASEKNVPPEWLAVPHETASERPSRGTIGQLAVATVDAPLAQKITLVDTPDLDGDQPAHHAQAERAFRWATAVLFVVTPEKYQMTELPPYYRLADRYGTTAWYVMNKCESAEQVDDYRRQLPASARVFAVPRDDSVFAAPAMMSLDALRQSLGEAKARVTDEALAARTADVLDRLMDQVVTPLQRDRRAADELIASLRALSTPTASVDVNPITRSLQKRMQERSVLYLIGPGRVIDRVRQVPTLLARLPRATWDYFRGTPAKGNGDVSTIPEAREVPDFAALLADQLAILHSRVDDLLRDNAIATQWIARDDAGYKAAQLNADSARAIANEELADLKKWLESRWNATPRDTRLLQMLIKYLPGGEKLTQWSEAAPYLLAVVVATHHAFFGHIDLLILGGYTLGAWLTEKISNEVSARTRKTNSRIAERFGELAQRQIEQYIAWIDSQSPSRREIAGLMDTVEKLSPEHAV
jgi:hypothetical protein